MAETAIDYKVVKAGVIAPPGLERATTGLDIQQRNYAEFLNKNKAGVNSNDLLLMMTGQKMTEPLAIAAFDEKFGGPTANRNAATGEKDRTAAPAYEQNEYNATRAELVSLYDNLERGVITDRQRGQVLGVLFRDEGYKDILRGIRGTIDADITGFLTNPNTIPPELRDVVNSIINRPIFKVKLAEIIAKRLDPSKKAEAVGGVDTTTLNAELTQLRTQLADAYRDLNLPPPGSAVGTPAPNTGLSLQERVNDAMREANRFRVTPAAPPAPAVPGDRLGELTRIRGDITAATNDITTLQTQVDNLTTIISRLPNSATPAERAGYVGQQTAALGTLTARRTALTAAQNELTAIETEQRQILDAETNLRKELTTLQERRQTMERDIRTKEAQVRGAGGGR